MSKVLIARQRKEAAKGTAPHGNPRRRQITVLFTDKQFRVLAKHAKTNNISFAESVRQCVDGSFLI